MPRRATVQLQAACMFDLGKFRSLLDAGTERVPLIMAALRDECWCETLALRHHLCRLDRAKFQGRAQL